MQGSGKQAPIKSQENEEEIPQMPNPTSSRIGVWGTPTSFRTVWCGRYHRLHRWPTLLAACSLISRPYSAPQSEQGPLKR